MHVYREGFSTQLVEMREKDRDKKLDRQIYGERERERRKERERGIA